MSVILIPTLLGEMVGNPWETLSFKAAVFSAIFTAFAGICAGGWAVFTRHRDRALELEQRKKELRWKQAELARKLLDDIFDYVPSNDAWRMVDGEEMYKDAQGNEFQINMDQVRRALPKPWNEEKGGPDVYIRWCFDALFYYLERLEQSIELGLINEDDVLAAAAYYVALMANDKKVFQEYAILIRFERAVTFLDRFPEWKERRTDCAPYGKTENSLPGVIPPAL